MGGAGIPYLYYHDLKEDSAGERSRACPLGWSQVLIFGARVNVPQDTNRSVNGKAMWAV